MSRSTDLRIRSRQPARTGTDIRLHGPSTWANNFMVKVAYAEQFGSDRVFIAGESAHVQTGGGLCSAIYDSSNLSWKIASVLHGGPVWLLGARWAMRVI